MQPFHLYEAAQAAKGVLYAPPEQRDALIRCVTIDSRKVEPGALFIPIQGERFDGHDFIPAAYAAGACCCLTQRPLDTPLPYILVEDTAQAFQNMAAWYKSRMGAKTVGITGSVGKTTTKEFVAGVLRQRFDVMYSKGNLNNQTGVPLMLFQLEPHHEAAVIEMGTNHFGEIDCLARMVRPDICLLTNIGTAHIEHFGSRAGIFQGKCEMLSHMVPGGRVVVNGDDDMLVTLKTARQDVTTFGLRPEHDVYASQVENLGLCGMRFIAHYEGKQAPIQLKTPGLHMVYNALAALAIGRMFGMDIQSIQQGLNHYEALAGRMCIQQARSFTILNDVYNANPASMKASLDVLQSAAGRKVCILGDMLELGDQAATLHREVGAYAAKLGMDSIVCIGALAQYLYQGAIEAGAAHAQYFPTLEEGIAALPNCIHSGDHVLVKASRSLHFEQIVNALLQI